VSEATRILDELADDMPTKARCERWIDIGMEMRRMSRSIEQERRADAEMALALMREDLNRALAYKQKYNADDHNICLAIVSFRHGPDAVLAAYSNDAAIPLSLRLGLHLVPNVYGLLPSRARFGCDGMAQYHTEPKLLNFLCASPGIRLHAYQSPPAGEARGKAHATFLKIVEGQRRAARAVAEALQGLDQIAELTIVTEIDCCRTCVPYAIDRFRALAPHAVLRTIELGKIAGQATQYRAVTVSR
jgi:hypothetical protein